MLRRRHVFFLIAFLSLIPAGTSHAVKVVALGIEEVVARADRIFVGTCVEVRGERDPEHGIVVTRYTFTVSRPVKGQVGGTVTFRQYGGSAGKRRTVIDGLPVYRPGEEVVLFLKPDSAWGLTSPVGLFQGRYEVSRDGVSGRKTVVQDLYAPHLSGEALSRAARARSKPARLSGEGRMDLEDFMGLIEGMVKGER
ncbi:MAG: hypothetical protein EXS64_18775 [Candidatus Latescibacteria bacterium]|nr:hypothetical protein [Candidatus Latescibacterota bacterium]